MLSRIRNNYEKQQKKVYFRPFLSHKQKIDRWCMTARGSMDDHVNHCSVANRDTGQEWYSPADTEVREGGDKVPQALVSRFLYNPQRAMLEQMYSAACQDPRLQQLCGCPSSQPRALGQGDWESGRVSIQQPAEVNPRHWSATVRFCMLVPSSTGHCNICNLHKYSQNNCNY